MKIVHVLHNLRGGGIQNLLLSLAPMQVKMGNQVILVVTDKDKMEYSIKLREKVEKENVSVIYLNRTVGNTISSLITIFRSYNILHKLNADIVNSHGPLSHKYAAIGTIFTKSTHILTIHNAPEPWSKSGYLLNRRKSKIFCSQAAFEMNDYKEGNNVVIANGVDKNMVVSNNRSKLREELKISDKAKIIVGVGALRKQKNYSFWVDLAKVCDKNYFHFIICGGHFGQDFIDPSLFGGIENLTWLGIRSDVPEIINEADCFLSCSTFEGLPIAVLEAYFSGIPCVLSPIPQHIDIIENVSECYIPEKFEVSDFKNSLVEACFSGKSHNDIQKEREPYIEKFSVKRTANEYIDFYNKCMEN